MDSVKGVFLLSVGIAGLIATYSFRPPSGFGDALMMLGKGRDFYLKEPVFLGLMALSGFIAILGLVLIIKPISKD